MRGDLPHPKPRKDTQVKHLSHPWYLLYNLIIKKKILVAILSSVTRKISHITEN